MAAGWSLLQARSRQCLGQGYNLTKWYQQMIAPVAQSLVEWRPPSSILAAGSHCSHKSHSPDSMLYKPTLTASGTHSVPKCLSQAIYATHAVHKLHTLFCARALSHCVLEQASEAEGRRSPAPGLRREGSGLSALRLSTSLHTSRELESRLAESYSGWHVKDIDWRFVLSAQHYGTAITTLAILIALIVVHWTLPATKRVFFVYDTSISYISHGDTIPGWVTVVVPMICLLLSLVSYECFIYRRFVPQCCMLKPCNQTCYLEANPIEEHSTLQFALMP